MVYIIAEIGTGHNGDIRKAKKLIRAASDSGADCAKFQMVYADEIIHPETGTVELPGGNLQLYNIFKDLERPPSFYGELKDITEGCGMQFLCSPFGIRSARFLREMDVSMIKIASPELNHFPLLREIASYHLPVFLSTGVSKLGDIEEALTVLRQAGIAQPVTLLHCVTNYPAPETEYNLRVLGSLSSIFGIPAGISDHSLHPEIVPGLSAALGAAVIEKHLCLERTDSGLDDPIALDPENFRKMCAAVRKAESVPPEDTIRSYEERFGRETVSAVLGNGIKQLAPAEARHYSRTNRSVHALTDLPRGTVLTEANTALLRTEKLLTPGLHPRWYETVLGKTVQEDIPAGEGICWEHLLSGPARKA